MLLADPPHTRELSAELFPDAGHPATALEHVLAVESLFRTEIGTDLDQLETTSAKS